jgi:hypothetical protein
MNNGGDSTNSKSGRRQRRGPYRDAEAANDKFDRNRFVNPDFAV